LHTSHISYVYVCVATISLKQLSHLGLRANRIHLHVKLAVQCTDKHTHTHTHKHTLYFQKYLVLDSCGDCLCVRDSCVLMLMEWFKNLRSYTHTHTHRQASRAKDKRYVIITHTFNRHPKYHSLRLADTFLGLSAKQKDFKVIYLCTCILTDGALRFHVCFSQHLWWKH